MWSYYGAKTNVIHLYPKPKHNLIIEPFAGTARYALKYFEHDIILVDKYDVVIKIWQWLQKCAPPDILSLPRYLEPNQSLNDFTFDCEEARMLMGFLIGFGMEAPRKTQSAKRAIQRPNFLNYSIKRIAANLFKIKHWDIRLGNYDLLENQTATWFVDPPYQHGGECYPASSKQIDFFSLAQWCKKREGQVIVCENSKANWLPFQSIAEQKTRTGWQNEVVWSNHKLTPIAKQIVFF